MRGAAAAIATAVAVVACCAALPLVLAALGGLTAALAVGSAGLALASALLLGLVVLRRHRKSCAAPDEGDEPTAPASLINASEERSNA